jgi:hypothetical protein
MENPGNLIKNFLMAPLRGQSYLNLIYLFLTFPLGLFYFIFLVVGFALGIPLLIIWIGLLVLLVVFAAWWVFVVIERQLAIWLLRAKVSPLTRQDMTGKSVGEQLMAHLTNPVTWKGLIYLLLKFPLGLFTFVIGTVLVALSSSLLMAPLVVLFSSFNLEVLLTWNNIWVVDTLPEALILFVIGIPVTWVFVNLMNSVAWGWARFSELMLGNPQVSRLPAAAGLPIVPAAPAAPAEPMASPLNPSPEASGEPFDSAEQVNQTSSDDEA